MTINDVKETVEKLEKLAENAEEYAELTRLLEEVGIDVAGNVETPNIVLQDVRLTPEAKLFYMFSTTLVGYDEPFAPKISAIAERLGVEVEVCQLAIEELIMFGYFELKSENLYRIKKPQMNDDAFFGEIGREWVTRKLGQRVVNMSSSNAKHTKAKVVDVVLKRVIEELATNIPEEAEKVTIELDFETNSVVTMIE